MDNEFFKFDKSQLGTSDTSFNEEEDDTDYDALNSETFGEITPSSNWEEDHEELASQLEKRNKKKEEEKPENDLSEKIASFILDDEGEDSLLAKQQWPSKSHQTSVGPSGGCPWWSESSPIVKMVPKEKPVKSTSKASTPIPDSWWEVNKPKNTTFTPNHGSALPLPPVDVNTLSPSKPAKILTVEEIEKKMRVDAEVKGFHKATSPPITGFHKATSPPITMGYERVGKDLPGTAVRDYSTNGQYSMNRPPIVQPMMRRQRFRHHDAVPEGHHPLPVRPPYPHYPDAMPNPHRHPHPPNIPTSSGLHNPQRHPGPVVFPRQMLDQQRYMSPPHLCRPPIDQHHHDRNQYCHHQQSGYARPGPSQPVDEYAGLMSPQEKHWLSTIQMMQLNSNQPYQDDYYYLMYHQRQQGISGRKLGNHGLKNNRDLAAAKPTATYTPLQFENSLGKLQIGSVTAPRKIIDMDLVENVESTAKVVEKRSKQILMEIEEIYTHILQLEDASNPLYNLMSQKSEHMMDKKTLQDKAMSTILSTNKLISVMNIRKGKKAVLRMLPLLCNPAPLIHQLLVDLVPITRKDMDQHMLSFLPYIRSYLLTVPLSTIVQYTERYDTPFLLSNKLAISVMANMVERAEQVLREGEVEDSVLQKWTVTLQRMAESTERWAEAERPVVGLDRTCLSKHLSLISNVARDEQVGALIIALSSLQPRCPAAP